MKTYSFLATKKRKVSSPDSTQHRLDRFLSPASKQPSPAKEDLMQVEKPSAMKQPRLESNEISYTKHTLAPAITITNLNRKKINSIEKQLEETKLG